ncbi:MAG: rhodanese-like domain-containing protein [Deltaproteobacteria bacterium]|nr:MAG: rhodanese-like domain-containing protein [Deltaproteobacteria bacterium]
MREEGALLIDVRTPEEFAEGHVEGAWNVPVDRVEQELSAIEAKAGGDKSKPIVVYCRSGRRAAKAKEILLQHGFTRVTNLGGLSDWCEDC